MFKDDTEIHLTGKTFDLLVLLVKAPGQLQTRDDLVSALWPDTIVEDHSLTWNVSALRRALGDAGDTPVYIQTVRGHGYRFIATVRAELQARPSTNKITDGPDAADTTDTPAPQPVKRRPWRWIAALMALLAIAGGLIWHFEVNPRPVVTYRPPSKSIAILPFENQSRNKSDIYFVRGLHDLILTKLAGIKSLKVIAASSTRDYPSHPHNLARIARQLGVANLLEGSIQRVGGQLLINVRLVNAKNGSHIWAQSYVRKFNDILGLESDVAQKVTEALKLNLQPRESNQLKKVLTKNPQALDLFLQAEYYAEQTIIGASKDPSSTANKAVQLYKQAISKDPGFAQAWARLSILDSQMYWYNIQHTLQRMKRARQTAERAMTLDSEFPGAHLAMGYVYYYGGSGYAKALVQFQKAHQAAPNDTQAMGAIAFIHRRQGDWKNAVNELRRVRILDPRNPFWYHELGETLVLLRRYDQAVKEFDHALSVTPHSYRIMGYKAIAQLLSGNLQEAHATLGSIPSTTDPRGLISAIQFKLFWLMHRPKKALTTLDSVKNEWITAPFTPGATPASLLRAQALSLLGNQTKAHLEYSRALAMVKKTLGSRPDDPHLLSILARIQGGLGEQTASIQTATRATKLQPISKDAVYGPSHLATLAHMYAQFGNADAAVKALRRLLAVPAGLSVSVSLLKLDSIWDPIRHNPAFQVLLKKYSHKIPPSIESTQKR